MAADATVDDATGPAAAAGGELRCPFGSPGPATGTRPRPKRGYLLPGSIALVVCAAIAVTIDVAGIQSHTPSSLDGRQVEAFVSQSLQYSHPQASPPQVRCPADEPLRLGFTFTCRLIAGGHGPGVIKVTETSANGTFRFVPPPSG